MMAGIRGKHTRPEMAVRRFLHRQGLRFRLHGRHLPGKPDLVFAKYRVVVHVHGCFWHQHSGCRFAYMPVSNRDFWQTKLRQNVARDARNDVALAALGWRSITVWECEVTDERALTRLVSRIRGKR